MLTGKLTGSLRDAYGTRRQRSGSISGASWGPLGNLLDPLGSSWVPLEPSWVPLGCLLGPLGYLSGPLGDHLAALCFGGPPRKRARGLREAYGKLTGSLRELTRGSGEGAEFAS